MESERGGDHCHSSLQTGGGYSRSKVVVEARGAVRFLLLLLWQWWVVLTRSSVDGRRASLARSISAADQLSCMKH